MLHICSKVTSHSLTILGSVQRCKIKSEKKTNKKKLHSKNQKKKSKPKKLIQGSRVPSLLSRVLRGCMCIWIERTQNEHRCTWSNSHSWTSGTPHWALCLQPPATSKNWLCWSTKSRANTRLGGMLQGSKGWIFFTDRLETHQCLHNVGLRGLKFHSCHMSSM